MRVVKLVKDSEEFLTEFKEEKKLLVHKTKIQSSGEKITACGAKKS